MSERPGLSIFDEGPSNRGNDDATQVIPATGASRESFPVVRRGGYDQAAVDKQMHTLAGEKAGLAAVCAAARICTARRGARKSNGGVSSAPMHRAHRRG